MPKPSTRLRVFVVDDEYTIATTVATILRNHDFDATAFTEPLLALQAAQSNAPDLLVSDVMMPEMSGVELAIRIQKLHPECKVLLSSGSAHSAELLETALAIGHDYAFLPKPVHPADLVERINTLVTDADIFP